MASKTNKSVRNQGPRLAPRKGGKVSGVPMKPALAANIKNAYGRETGLRQGKGGANFVSATRPGGGVNQSKNLAARRVMGGKKAQTAKVGKAQPKSPKGLQNDLVLHNKVGAAEIARLHKAAQAPMPKLTGGAFKGFIGAK